MKFHGCNEKSNNETKTKKDAVKKWHTKAVNITTNLKAKIYFTLPECIVTKYLM